MPTAGMSKTRQSEGRGLAILLVKCISIRPQQELARNLHFTKLFFYFCFVQSELLGTCAGSKNTPTAGIEPASPEGRGLAIRCNTIMRCGHMN